MIQSEYPSTKTAAPAGTTPPTTSNLLVANGIIPASQTNRKFHLKAKPFDLLSIRHEAGVARWLRAVGSKDVNFVQGSTDRGHPTSCNRTLPFVTEKKRGQQLCTLGTRRRLEDSGLLSPRHGLVRRDRLPNLEEFSGRGEPAQAGKGEHSAAVLGVAVDDGARRKCRAAHPLDILLQ